MGLPKHKVAAVVIVMNEDDKILLVKGRQRGWECPGGYAEEGELIKDAAIREVREETGIDIVLTKFCGIYQNLKRATYVFFFIGKPVSGSLKTSYESLEVGYFTLDEALTIVTRKDFKKRILECLETEHPFLKEF